MADFQNRIAGELYVKIDGELQDGKGSFTYNLGHPLRTPVYNTAMQVVGYKEEAQTPKVEGALTDRGSLDLEKLVTADGVTVTLVLANGKTITYSDAWYAGAGDVTSEEAEIAVAWHSKQRGVES